MSGYFADQASIAAADFVARACDPAQSVVVEACAGSGKTWLLVSRIVRLLLAGAAPGDILAITFTRRAAQEMRERLIGDLRLLAAAGDDEIVALLQQRGMPASEATAAVAEARGLYERVLTARVPLTIDTFHGWFWLLAARAPLGAGVPFAPALLEAVDRIRRDAWLQFSAALLRAEHAEERAAWLDMVDLLGEYGAERVLLELLDKRAEWWAFAGDDQAGAIDRALQPLMIGGSDEIHARVRAPAFVEALRAALDLWCSATRPSAAWRSHCDAIRAWLDEPHASPRSDFSAICRLLLTLDHSVRMNLTPARLGARLDATRYAPLHAHLVQTLQQALADLRVRRARRLTRAGLICGRLLIAQYQTAKERQQSLDFTDLEWHAHRLLADDDHAAYMQARLDARYRHILLDEFQDTNALQWQVLQSWLSAYGPNDDGASDRPTVFVVGDPKQSIYRFRRAEPRVFLAALELLARDFGARHLRTDVTRRNGAALIDLLNRVMPGANPLYHAQTTLADARGSCVLLPLSQPVSAVTATHWRDVLQQPRTVDDPDSHYREARALADEIVFRVANTPVSEDGKLRAAGWADVLVLVRNRTHLVDFERAFRDAGVPFVSDRGGGLLATLEADDLTALLQILTTPGDNVRLAHALRSPVFGVADEDLIRLAQQSGGSWYQRLQQMTEPLSPALQRARELLLRWQTLASVLPVHDLLDRIYFEGDVRRRYAAAVPAAVHAQVQANLDSFIELALALDAGRYPSLTRFIDELVHLKRHASDDAPDEGPAAAGDAVRLMTIHGAKGLEADIVAIAGAHAREPREQPWVMVAWPPAEAAPRHLSLVEPGDKHRDYAREAWFAEEQAQCEQEDWNLLYVAATRARRVLIVSGTVPRSGASGSWYERLMAASDLFEPPAPAQPLTSTNAARQVRDFLPAPLPTGSRFAVSDTDAQRIGRAWHAMLEIDDRSQWPAVARSHRLDVAQGDQLMAAAARVRQRLPHLFANGHAELEVLSAAGELLRIDRLVEYDGALWIIDFKWRVTDAERTLYQSQLQAYALALRDLHPQRRLRAALVQPDASIIEVSLA